MWSGGGKNISFFVWSEKVLKIEEILLDMLADQVGQTRIKCFMVLEGLGRRRSLQGLNVPCHFMFVL